MKEYRERERRDSCKKNRDPRHPNSWRNNLVNIREKVEYDSNSLDLTTSLDLVAVCYVGKVTEKSQHYNAKLNSVNFGNIDSVISVSIITAK